MIFVYPFKRIIIKGSMLIEQDFNSFPKALMITLFSYS